MKNITTNVKTKRDELILKLRTPSHNYIYFGRAIKPEVDIDQINKDLCSGLKNSIMDASQAIHNEIKSVRPSEDNPYYKSSLDICANLARSNRDFLNVTLAEFDEAVTNYRVCVDELRNDIENGADRQRVEDRIQQFRADSDELFQNVVQWVLDSYLSVIETKFLLMEQ